MKEKNRHRPIRTCISCGTKRSKEDLIRLILNAHGFLVRDEKGQGRGAYVCPNRTCWESLKKGKHLSRAFRREDPLAFSPGLRFE